MYAPSNYSCQINEVKSTIFPSESKKQHKTETLINYEKIAQVVFNWNCPLKCTIYIDTSEERRLPPDDDISALKCVFSLPT